MNSLLALIVASVSAASLTEGKITTVEEGLQFTEGPVWLASGTLAFSDIPADTIYGFDKKVLYKPSGSSNGLTLDPQGRLIRCEHGNRRVVRIDADGKIEVLADQYKGKKLNSPNDAVARSDGMIFFTDPPYGLGGRPQEVEFNGVYALKPGGDPVLLQEDFARPNGIALSPDEKTLYVADTEKGHIRAFDLDAEGNVSNGRVLAEIMFPDGIRVDNDGNIWSSGVLSGKGVIGVFDAKGKLLEAIEFPQNPANCGFGGEDGKTLYVTARTAVYSIRTTVSGLRGR